MKSYVTEGTGSQQTLTDSQDNKIPIYDSKEDVEADLANLAVGQIVATTDTGDELAQPVNVVEEGNLHAVSSNAVAESLSYSETEQKTGGKWIDGKPIYRKVVDIGALPNNTSKTVNHNIQNIDKVLDTKIIAKDSTNYIVFNYGSGSSVYISTTKISISVDLNYNQYSGYAIIEYTKTTD